MVKEVDFDGFSHGVVDFFQDLEKNNDKGWFEQNKEAFDRLVMSPARAFVSAMGERLRSISPAIVADPRVNKSIFRIYRDTRFSLDKSPYKTHLGIFFWEGRRRKMECSGFYFHLEPPRLMLAAGIYMLPKSSIHGFRTAVVDPGSGDELAEVRRKIAAAGRYVVGGEHYRRLPPGYDPAHPNADLLLHNGLYASLDEPVPGVLFSPRLVDHCHWIFADLAPLHHWLVTFLEGGQDR